MTIGGRVVVAACCLFAALGVSLSIAWGAGQPRPAYPWPRDAAAHDTLSQRINPPLGYDRVDAAPGSFASWLRGLPLRPLGTPVRLYDGRKKGYQGGVFAVVDIDVGSDDLQQCADAVIRLRAEYLFQTRCAARIAFAFTSGDHARWSDWSAGLRPKVSGSKVSWQRGGEANSSYTSFRAYLNSVFTYAGSASLSRELVAVADPSTVQPGDVFIHGGFPGHAVLVADVARNAHGEKVFLLVQSYMPAQDIHVLANPAEHESAWYPARRTGTLVTPEWTFSYSELKRFADADCAAAQPD